MHRRLGVGVALGVGALCVYAGMAQPPDRPEREVPYQQGRPSRPNRQGDGPPPGPPHWRLGSVMPPPVRDELNLTEEQEKQLQDLEKEVRDRVLKMLTTEQRRQLERLERRGPPGRFRRGAGGPPGRGTPPQRPDRDDGRDGE